MDYHLYIIEKPNAWICKLCGYGQFVKPSKTAVMRHLLKDHVNKLKTEAHKT